MHDENKKSLLLKKVSEYDPISRYTESQTDEILSQRREMVSFAYKSVLQNSWDNKFYLVAIFFFIFGFAGMVLR